MLSKEQLQNFKTLLVNEKKKLEERTLTNDHFGLSDGHFHESMGELSSYDNHPADEGSELYEREKDVALNEHANLEIKNIERALNAIKNGTYGRCEICNREIDLERLEALPNTTYCIEHSPDQHISQNRPIEEDVISPPFAQYDMDEKHENVSYDAEDSWQELAHFGTSETPSDLMTGEDRYADVYIESDENIGYVEDYENFVGVDITGRNITVFPTMKHEAYEADLDEEGIMTTFGDLPQYEHEPYVSTDIESDSQKDESESS